MNSVTSIYRTSYIDASEVRAPYTLSTDRPPVVRQPPRNDLHEVEQAYQFFRFKQAQVATYLDQSWVTTKPHFAALTTGGLRDSAIEYLRLCKQKNITPNVSLNVVNAWLGWAGRVTGMSNQPEFRPLSDETLIRENSFAYEVSHIQPQAAHPSTATVQNNSVAVPPTVPLQPQEAPQSSRVTFKRTATHNDALDKLLCDKKNVTETVTKKKFKTTHAPSGRTTHVLSGSALHTKIKPLELDESACNFLRNMNAHGDQIFEHLSQLLHTGPEEKLTARQLKGFVTCGVAALLYLNQPRDEELRGEVAMLFFRKCAETAYSLAFNGPRELADEINRMLVNDHMPKVLPRILSRATADTVTGHLVYSSQCLDLQEVLGDALEADQGKQYASYEAFLAKAVPATYRELFRDSTVAADART